MVAADCGALVGLAEEMRDIPFDEKARCDNCGQEGSLDFYGDNYCLDCLSEYEAPNCFYADPPTLKEFFQSLIEWMRIEIRRIF